MYVDFSQAITQFVVIQLGNVMWTEQGLVSSLCGAPGETWVCKFGRVTHRTICGKSWLKSHPVHSNWVEHSHNHCVGSSVLCRSISAHKISLKHTVLRLGFVCLCVPVDALKSLTGRPSAAF